MPDDPITMPDSSASLTKDGQLPDHNYYGIFQRLVERFNTLRNQADDTETGLDTKAAKEGQTESYEGLILVAANQAYILVLKCTKARTITEVTMKSTSGTCTAALTIDGVALGGGANSVTSSEASVAHTSANFLDVGQTLTLTISANSSALNVNFSIAYTYDLI